MTSFLPGSMLLLGIALLITLVVIFSTMRSSRDPRNRRP